MTSGGSCSTRSHGTLCELVRVWLLLDPVKVSWCGCLWLCTCDMAQKAAERPMCVQTQHRMNGMLTGHWLMHNMHMCCGFDTSERMYCMHVCALSYYTHR